MTILQQQNPKACSHQDFFALISIVKFSKARNATQLLELEGKTGNLLSYYTAQKLGLSNTGGCRCVPPFRDGPFSSLESSSVSGGCRDSGTFLALQNNYLLKTGP